MTRNADRVQAGAAERQRRRATTVENILEESEALLSDPKSPTSSHEIATEYADSPLDMANETESLGDVFDRIQEQYGSPQEALEVVYEELREGRPPEVDRQREREADVDPDDYDLSARE